MKLSILILGAAMSLDAQNTIVSRFAAGDPALTLDAGAALWAQAEPVRVERERFGAMAVKRPTEVRSRWTVGHLYLLFVCPYERMHLKPNPVTATETDHLWDWDVAEAFIGADLKNIGRYTEYEVSPQGEWVDLDIDRGTPRPVRIEWNSGLESLARVDAAKKIWYAAMKIPMKAIGVSPENGRRLRVNFYRIEGPPPDRTYLNWQPVNNQTFHTPEVFGWMRLEGK